jgi:hypothetical protein
MAADATAAVLLFSTTAPSSTSPSLARTRVTYEDPEKAAAEPTVAIRAIAENFMFADDGSES